MTADLILVGIAFIWGMTFPMVKTGIEHIPVMDFLALRFAIASLVLAPFALPHLRNFQWKNFAAGAFTGLFLLAGYAFQTMGMKYTSASNAAFITGLSVVLVPVLSILFLKERINLKTLIGVGFATLGLFFLSGGSFVQFNFGDCLEMGCALSFGIQIIAVSKLAKEGSSLQFTLAQMISVALGSWVLSPFFSDTHVALSATPWFPIVFTAVFASSGAFWLQTICQKKTSATRTALAFATEPFWGALFARILLAEQLSRLSYLGGALLILGMISVEVPTSVWAKILRR